MKLVEKSISDFSGILASGAPTPGGGSAAALTGALGASLISMVASLTIGRKKYAEYEPLMKDIVRRADELRLKMLYIIDHDADAYNTVTASLAMPKDSAYEKAARSTAIQAALKACTVTPFEILECSLRALELAQEMTGRFNTNAASDLGVAALNLKAAAQGAWLNVLINLDGIRDDVFVSRYRQSGSELVRKAIALADGIGNALAD